MTRTEILAAMKAAGLESPAVMPGALRLGRVYDLTAGSADARKTERIELPRGAVEATDSAVTAAINALKG